MQIALDDSSKLACLTTGVTEVKLIKYRIASTFCVLQKSLIYHRWEKNKVNHPDIQSSKWHKINKAFYVTFMINFNNFTTGQSSCY